MADVRLGIVGLGSMGAQHARALVDGAIAGATLVAVCDSDPSRLEAFPLVARFARSAASMQRRWSLYGTTTMQSSIVSGRITPC